MGVYQVGEVIRRTRESLGITQETLSEGICSVETLSRIENGKRMPSRANFEAIMERMGKPGEKYLPFIHDSNIQLHVMQREIARLLAIQDYEKTKRKLEQMEQLLDMDDHVNQQYVLRTKAIVRYRLGEITGEEEREELMQALKCTVKNHAEGEAIEGIWSRYELFLMINIAVSYMDEEKWEDALKILKEVEEYFAKVNIDIEERSISEVYFLCILSQCLGKKGEIEKALKIGREAQRLSIGNHKSSNLPHVLYNIGYDEKILGEGNEAGLEKMIQAYYVAEQNGAAYMMEHIKKNIMELY